MKIVHVEDFVHPEAGYQVNLLSRLQRQEGHEVTIVAGELDKAPATLTGFFGKDGIAEKDAAFERETGVRLVRVGLFGYLSGRAIFKPRLFKTVAALEPDVVLVHGETTLTGILFILFSPWLRYPIALDCHMLEMASRNRLRRIFRFFFRRLLTPVILRRKIPLIRVVDSDFVEKWLGIPLSYTDLLSFGTDTSHFRPDSERRQQVRAEHGIPESAFLVIYAGKLDEAKGGDFLARSLRERFAPAGGRALEFLVIGNSVGALGEEIERLFAVSENRIVRLPTQRYFDLAGFYQAADLMVFPRQCSMSFFEAQSCGLPVLFEDNEINGQRAAAGNAFTFAPGDVGDLRRRLAWLAGRPADAYADIRDGARAWVLANHDYVPIAREFTAVLERAVAEWPR